MAVEPAPHERLKKSSAMHFLLRGLAISLPSVLTLVILIWIGRGIYNYVVYPISELARFSIAQTVEKARPTDQLVAWERLPLLEYAGRNYRITPEHQQHLQRLLEERKDEPGVPAELRREDIDEEQAYVAVGNRGRSVPYKDYQLVARNVHPNMPTTVTGLYMEVVTHRHFPGLFNLSALAVIATVVLLYFLGRLVTARIGTWVVHKFETAFMGRLPVVSNVYSSVKQVTDFFLSERKVEYNRVVAVEYPRRGIWSLGFVTSDSLLELTAAAGEPLLSVLMPTSPMPMTGFTINVPRSEVLDLNITLDQAFQFCLSCGVLVPPQQRVTPELLQQELARRLTGSALPGHRKNATLAELHSEAPAPVGIAGDGADAMAPPPRPKQTPP